MIQWMNCSDLPSPQHYHVVSGMRGYLPDSNTYCLYRGAAHRTMVEFKFLIGDQCDHNHVGTCVSGNTTIGYTVIAGHGVEYAEIIVCKEDCKIGEDYH